MLDSLRTRIFLVISLLVALCVGGAATISVIQGNQIAYDEVVSSLERSRAIQASTKEDRFQNLLLMNQLISSDPYFASYISEAAGADLGFGGETIIGTDSESINDLINDRNETLQYQYGVGYDFAYVLDAEGYLLATTDIEPLPGDDFSENEVLEPLIADLSPVTGYWSKSDRVYQIAGVPLASSDELVGFLVLGLEAADEFVQSIREESNTEIAILGKQRGEYFGISSSLPDSATQMLSTFLSSRESVSPDTPFEIVLDGNRWIAIFDSLSNTGDVGVSVSLISLDEALEGFTQLRTLLIIVAIVSIALAVIVGYLLAMQIVKPIVRLADAAQTAARGDYGSTIENRAGQNEIAVLTNSFNSLLSDLREKSDMENFMMSLARLEPESEEEAALRADRKPVDRPAERVATMLAIEFRNFNESEVPPADLAPLIESANRQLDIAMKRHNGVQVASSGFRSFHYFSHENGLSSALACIQDAAPQFSQLGVEPCIAIARGKIITATIRLEGHLNEISVGKPWAILERLLAETQPGNLLFTKNTLIAMQAQGIEMKPVEQPGRLSKKPYAGLPLGDVSIQSEGEETTIVGTSTSIGLESLGVLSPDDIKPGMIVNDRYEIISQLGSGAMGVVYKTYDRELEDVIAVKLINVSMMDQQLIDLMKSEIRLARKITDPNILRTFDFGEVDGLPFISMEYVRGMTLKYVLDNTEGLLPFSAALQISKQLCNGLIAAHDADIAHRDVKPANLMLDFGGRVKLMDFGLAGSGKGKRTVGGTPRYASPEQLVGQDTGASADIYSMGILMYELFTGAMPFQVSGRDLRAIANIQRTVTPQRAIEMNDQIPEALDELIMRCIKPKPELRPASIREVLGELEEVTA